jgi:predicted TIM-barrel fold metal-dependent hydrolase
MISSVRRLLVVSIVSAALWCLQTTAIAQGSTDEFNDAHFHLTNYIQKGISIKDYLTIMGNRVGRSTLFGIPLQQQWSYRLSGKQAPEYYLDTDAPLYYYSYTDAFIANAYKALSKEDQERFDPMITGFNPTDMYAADHIRRVLNDYPGVFSGIGEFTIHKEFVSSKVAGEVASLTDPALDRIFGFAAEAGLVVILHNDIDRPFAKKGEQPVYFQQVKALFERHPGIMIIWAHLGLGRVIQPVANHAAEIEALIKNPKLKNLYFDISWDEVAKYVTASEQSLTIASNLFNKYPDRFLFGTDTVAPKNSESYFAVYDAFTPVLDRLTPQAREKILKTNYERIFVAARRRVRAWEKTNVTPQESAD